MSALRSILDEMGAQDLSVVGSGELEDEVAELARAADVIQSLLLVRAAELDRRKSYRRDGITSTTGFLKAACDMAGSTAREKVFVARTLRKMPLTADRFSHGDLAYSKVRMLARAADAHPVEFERDEQVLVDSATSMTVAQFARVLDHWRQALDGPANLVDQREASYLHASKTIDGTVKIDGLLDREWGEVFLTAMDALGRPAARAAVTPQPARWRRAEAFVEICRRFLDRGETVYGGERPHITVLCDLASLEERAGRICEVGHMGSIYPETARRLACDAGVARVIVGPDSQPLDAGRRVRTAPPAQRRALVARDRHCRFPSCDRPAPWCDVHHVVHWADGGHTSVDNQLLLCRSHHTLVHEGGFSIGGSGEDPVFARADGTLLT